MFNKKKSPQKIGKRKVFSSLIPGDEKEYFIENLSMLLASGMDVLLALDSIKKEVGSSQMKTVVDNLKYDIDAGVPIWKALEGAGFFPNFIISLIRVGERSGRLVKNLKVISIQQKKERSFRSKVRSAMMYPLFVMGLTLIVGIGIAWFILPRLTLVFDQLKIPLPFITRALIGVSKFLSEYGIIVIPSFVFCLFLIFYFLFIFKKTKFIGQAMIFSFPGTKRLIQETEIARMGYILGTLLNAGLPIVDSLKSLAEVSNFYNYKKLYSFLEKSIEDGNTFQQSFSLYKKSRKLIPSPVKQMIVFGEKSGCLSESLISIGEIYEGKTDDTTKNLSVILEPILLVVVWLGVVTVAMAVILPIYSLIGGMNKIGESPSSAPKESTVIEEISEIEEIINISEAGEEFENVYQENKIEIMETPVGFLNVRNEASIRGRIISKVFTGEQYFFQEKKDGWYKIVLKNNEVGWIVENYTKIVSEGNDVSDFDMEKETDEIIEKETIDP